MLGSEPEVDLYYLLKCRTKTSSVESELDARDASTGSVVLNGLCFQKMGALKYVFMGR